MRWKWNTDMTQETARKKLDALLERLRLEQTIEDMEAEAEGRTQTTSQASVDRAMSRVYAALERFASGKPVHQPDAETSSDGPARVAPAARSKRNQLWSPVNRLSDWLAAVARLEFGALQFGNMATAHADSRVQRTAGSKSEPVHYCTWKQDGLQITLSCPRKAPYTVALHIDDGPDTELTQLFWIEEDELGGDVGAPVKPVEFPLERIGDRAYRVAGMDEDVFFTRMGSLGAAREREGEDSIALRLLLPFVK